MSNSSSFSWYSTFSSSSSKPGAYALQFSVIPVTQMWIKPSEETEAMRGRIGCHCPARGQVTCSDGEEGGDARRGPRADLSALRGF